MADLQTGKINEYFFMIDDAGDLSILQFANKDICIVLSIGEDVYMNCAMPTNANGE